MAGETLRELSEILTEFPDNTQGLITPLNARNMIVSEALGVAYVTDGGTDTTIAVVADTWVPIPPALTTPASTNNIAFAVDGNNNIINDYVSAGVTVNPSTFRLNALNAQFLVRKVTGNAVDYQFRWSQGGVAVGSVSDPVEVSTVARGVVFSRDVIADVSDQTPYVLEILGVGTGDDVILENFSIRATGALL